MENKHYTPEIEEFYVGFEYQHWCESKWKNTKVYGWSDFEDIAYSIPLNTIRVKYLDKEDIESLGWTEYTHGYGQYIFKHKNYSLVFWSNTSEHYTSNVYIKQETGLGLHSFKGTIKNKSELKRLMKQLGIEL